LFPAPRDDKGQPPNTKLRKEIPAVPAPSPRLAKRAAPTRRLANPPSLQHPRERHENICKVPKLRQPVQRSVMLPRSQPKHCPIQSPQTDCTPNPHNELEKCPPGAKRPR